MTRDADAISPNPSALIDTATILADSGVATTIAPELPTDLSPFRVIF
jgi:hypothetical protein